MKAWWKKWWPVAKLLLGVAILIAIGRRFAEDLQEPGLWQRDFRPGWMALSGLLYLLALGCSAFYWQRLLRGFGQRPSPREVVRSYFVGQLGKYLPGKAMALVMRAALVRGPRVSGGLAGLTAFYEVLTTMAAGALLAAGLLLLLAPETGGALDWETFRGLLRLEDRRPHLAAGQVRDWESCRRLLRLEESAASVLGRRLLVGLALVLFAPLGLVILPPVFNRLAGRLAAPFREKDAPALPRFGPAALVQGLLIAGCAWFLLGTSLWAMLQAVLTRPPRWTLEAWALDSAFMALAYVAGFIILLVPGGLGVREFFLTLFLVDPAAGQPRAAVLLAVLVLRLVWTTADLAMAAAVYWLPADGKSKKEAGLAS
jgi:uncharacterized membrane protein YbhN (UPF0104 family)